MKRGTHKTKLLEQLRKIPIIEVACRNVGINRSTFYRWINDDITFKAEVMEALLYGRDEIVDLAKVKLYKNLNEGKPWAVLFTLRYYDPDFKPLPRNPEKRPIWADELLTALLKRIDEMGENINSLGIPSSIIDEIIEEKENEDEEDAINQGTSGLD